MVAEISMRHFPDISESSLDQDFSESSFQIPSTGGSNDLLMDEASIDFLHNDTLGTPVPSGTAHLRKRAPLTLQDLTPRSTRTRSTPARSSLRPRAPAIATPLRTIVAKNISEALSEDISSASGQDLSFQIPTVAAHETDSLLDTHNNFNISDCADITLNIDHQPRPAEPAPLTLSQLNPQFNESLSEHASTSETLHTPEPAPDEPQIRAGNINGCIDGGQGVEPVAIQGACRGYFTLEGRSSSLLPNSVCSEATPAEPKLEEQNTEPHADPEHAPSRPLDKSVNSIVPTAKRGTRRTSDRFNRRKPVSTAPALFNCSQTFSCLCASPLRLCYMAVSRRRRRRCRSPRSTGHALSARRLHQRRRRRHRRSHVCGPVQ